MARQKDVIIKELNECETLYNRLAMEIGQTYALHARTKDDRLIPVINDKVTSFQRVEAEKRKLEKELSDSGE